MNKVTNQGNKAFIANWYEMPNNRYFYCVFIVVGSVLFLLILFLLIYENDTLPVGNVAFQNGDLVFIRGRTWRSWIVRFFDITDDYSHVGIVRFVDGVPKIIHAAPETETVQFESAEEFLSTSKADKAGVYRLKNNRYAEAASMEALGYFERGVSFDHRFDTLHSEALYCTELVWLAYKHAGIDLGKGEADFLYDSTPYGKVLLPGRLSKSEHLVKIEK